MQTSTYKVQYKECTGCRLALEAEWWVLGDNWESSVLFFVVFYQYITCALVYSFGSSFRLGLFYNWAVTVSIILAPPAPLLSPSIRVLAELCSTAVLFLEALHAVLLGCWYTSCDCTDCLSAQCTDCCILYEVLLLPRRIDNQVCCSSHHDAVGKVSAGPAFPAVTNLHAS